MNAQHRETMTHQIEWPYSYFHAPKDAKEDSQMALLNLYLSGVLQINEQEALRRPIVFVCSGAQS